VLPSIKINRCQVISRQAPIDYKRRAGTSWPGQKVIRTANIIPPICHPRVLMNGEVMNMARWQHNCVHRPDIRRQTYYGLFRFSSLDQLLRGTSAASDSSIWRIAVSFPRAIWHSPVPVPASCILLLARYLGWLSIPRGSAQWSRAASRTARAAAVRVPSPHSSFSLID